jgi:hypothetical protein
MATYMTKQIGEEVLIQRDGSVVSLATPGSIALTRISRLEI